VTARQVSIEEAIEILDADQSWKRYQVDWPEAELGRYAIQHFTILPRAIGRVNNLMAEGMDRDTGAGTFRRLLERHPRTDTCGVTWMSDTRAEIYEHAPMLNKLDLCARFGQAKRILINGLGLGLVANAALAYPRVEHVDVVEYDPEIVELVGQFLTTDPRVTIHLGDAYNISWPRGTRWDLAWHDIWPEISDDNLPGMARLGRKYKGKAGWQGYWQKRGCLRMKRAYDQMRAGTLPPESALALLEGRFNI
jgi:hypothetical protein